MPKLNKNFSIKKAHITQRCLSKKIIRTDVLPSKICRVGGIDVSYINDTGISAVTVLDYNSLELLEAQVATSKVQMPYVPTLLSFREIPPAIAAIKRLSLQPDVILVDAQGWAHPYRCGFASHLGLSIGKPTVGVAKNRLIGNPTKEGDRIVLIDRGEVIGEVVTTKQKAKPVYVSIGHMISLETAISIVKHCTKDRIPEPLLQAHGLARKERIKLALERKAK